MNDSESPRRQKEHMRDLLHAAASEKFWGFPVEETGLGDRFVTIRLASIGAKPAGCADPGSIVHIRSEDVLVNCLGSPRDGDPGWIAVDRGATVYEQQITARSVSEMHLSFLAPGLGLIGGTAPIPITLDPSPVTSITEAPPMTIPV